MKETDLYLPVKRFLTEQGFEVKAEVGACDVMAVKKGLAPVIVELKRGFALQLFHQAVDRLAVTDLVYIAVPKGKGKAWLKSLKENTKLARRLGLGLLVVTVSTKRVEPIVEPVPYQPRKSKRKTEALLKEFHAREGDPNLGGSGGTKIMTSYRQDAMKLAHFINQNGPSKGALIAKETGVERATTIMRDNHYGWFFKVERGVYGLLETGKSGAALEPVAKASPKQAESRPVVRAKRVVKTKPANKRSFQDLAVDLARRMPGLH